MMKFLLGGAAAAAIFASGAAFAADAPKPAPRAPGARHARMMQPATRASVQSHLATAFAKLDTNHDGFIAKDELSAVEAQRQQKIEQRAQRFDPSKIFARLDLNHDGTITAAEVEAAHNQRAQAKGAQPATAHATSFAGLFARADTNKDKVITRAEFDAMGQQIKARMEHAAATRGGMATRLFDTEDANKDGRISLAEMQQRALARFDRLDLNHDGTITPDERKQAQEQFKAQHHKS
jgi:Ca2+-binding EF-hand superfamily protein